MPIADPSQAQKEKEAHELGVITRSASTSSLQAQSVLTQC